MHECYRATSQQLDCLFNSLFTVINGKHQSVASPVLFLTHWVRVTHICVGKPTIIGSDNGLSPDRRQAIIWTNDGILLIAPLGTNFSEIVTGIQAFSFKRMHLKMSSAKLRPFCHGLNVLRNPPATSKLPSQRVSNTQNISSRTWAFKPLISQWLYDNSWHILGRLVSGLRLRCVIIT